MTITQTVEIPSNRRITLEVPREIPTGRVILSFTPEVGDCPLCAKHRDPKTGELRFNAETIASMQEVDDMLAGKIPNTLKKFNSLEEMLEDLDADD
jgi:Zn-dependent alcohol dehydrogenase